MVEKNIKIFKGDIIFTPTKDKFQTYKNAYIIVQDGKVKAIEKELKEEYRHLTIEDFTDKLIIPGFVDLHFHAPQFPNRGLGLDKELIPSLKKANTLIQNMQRKYIQKSFMKFGKLELPE